MNPFWRLNVVGFPIVLCCVLAGYVLAIPFTASALIALLPIALLTLVNGYLALTLAVGSTLETAAMVGWAILATAILLFIHDQTSVGLPLTLRYFMGP